MKEFKEFIKNQGVIGLAVGFILGGAISSVVTSLVNDIVNPLIGIFTGASENLKENVLYVGPATLRIGNFISVLIDFLIVSLVVYYTVKFLGLDKKTKKK
ncbi:MscL family protein [Patescibacteria group bacterium]